MARGDRRLEHVLRRVGFGASQAELASYQGRSLNQVIDALLNYEQVPDTVDHNIFKPEYIGVQVRGEFAPNTNYEDARARELFRMIHGTRPLQEKMALFWHNYFATAFSKVRASVGNAHATKLLAGKQGEIAGNQRGQYDLFRQKATGSFADLMFDIAHDPAMLYWLDGRNNTKQRAQENFARELLELFTLGLGNFTESDVYATARVFTGWTTQLSGDRSSADTSYHEFIFNPANHDTNPKTFTFPIYLDGGKTIPARAAAQGQQDGLDLILALVRHPLTAFRLARRLYEFFVSDLDKPSESYISLLANTFMQNNYSVKAVLRTLFTSEEFFAAEFKRVTWPTEFVVRAVKETGWNGFSIDLYMLTALINMGQQLYEPPDVNGWPVGAEWISTSTLVARMNFASLLMSNQRFNLGRELAPYGQSPDRVRDYMLNRFTYMPISQEVYSEYSQYASGNGDWTGSETQLSNKGAGLGRLIVGSGEYQFT